MRRLRVLSYLVFLFNCSLTLPAMAQDTADELSGEKGCYVPFEIGGHIALGFAGVMVDSDNDYEKSRFAGGGGIDGLLFFTSDYALHLGVGLLGKGYRTECGYYGPCETKHWYKYTYLEVPIGLLRDFHGFRFGGDIVFAYAIKGKEIILGDDFEDEIEFDGHLWDDHKRFNLAMKLHAGYAISMGPVRLIPGVSYTMHLLSDNADMGIRMWNFMFTLAALFHHSLVF